MEDIINISGITRDFALGAQTVKVLKGIDLNIKKGEYVALMGPSGSGKSTLMNILGCLDTPTSGTYVLKGAGCKFHDGRPVGRSAGIKEIGFVSKRSICCQG